jgi:SP family myo-inositol transporter-like MFS transporter 13
LTVAIFRYSGNPWSHLHRFSQREQRNLQEFTDYPRFLFGYDTGYISSVLVTIGTSLGHVLSTSEQELVTSLTSGGALVGAVGAGLTADRFGRKMPIWAACVVFVVGTVLQAAAYSVAQFAVGRFIVGLGVGSAAMVVPLYIGELAPAKYRKLVLLSIHNIISVS